MDELIKKLKNGMFASKPTFDEALEYAMSVFNTLEPGDKIAALTALWVVTNTTANELEKLNKEED